MLRIGARDSFLSKTQTMLFIKELRKKGIKAEFIPLKSIGDINKNIPLHHFNTVGVFTTIVEKALLDKKIDVGIHSYKDIPTIKNEKLKTVPVLKREDPRDILIIKKDFLLKENPLILSPGTRIGTGSLRRQALLLSTNPSVIPIDIRGNIETRINYLKRGWVDGIILAKAGIERAKINIPEEFDKISLQLEEYPTSPAQGILAAQYLKGNEEIEGIITEFIHSETKKQATIERKILEKIGSGCTIPLGATVYSTGLEKKGKYKISVAYAQQDWKKTFKPDIIRYQETGTLDELENQVEKIIRHILTNKIKQKRGQNIKKKRILISRDEKEDLLSTELEKLGYELIKISLFEYTYEKTAKILEQVRPLLSTSQWIILTSKRATPAVKIAYEEIKKQNKKLKIAAVGETTARELRKNDLPVHFVPTIASGKKLAEELCNLDNNIKEVIHLTTEKPLPHLKNVFEQNNIKTHQIITYYKQRKTENEIDKQLTKLKDNFFDAAVVFSPSQVEALLPFLEKHNIMIKNWIPIGSTTALKLKNEGINNVFPPKKTTILELLEVIEHVLSN